MFITKKEFVTCYMALEEQCLIEGMALEEQ